MLGQALALRGGQAGVMVALFFDPSACNFWHSLFPKIRCECAMQEQSMIAPALAALHQPSCSPKCGLRFLALRQMCTSAKLSFTAPQLSLGPCVSNSAVKTLVKKQNHSMHSTHHSVGWDTTLQSRPAASPSPGRA